MNMKSNKTETGKEKQWKRRKSRTAGMVTSEIEARKN